MDAMRKFPYDKFQNKFYTLYQFYISSKSDTFSFSFILQIILGFITVPMGTRRSQKMVRHLVEDAEKVIKCEHLEVMYHKMAKRLIS